MEREDPDGSVAHEAPATGTILIGRYRLDALLGSGGSADVWRAHDLRRDRVVTVKLLREREDLDLRRRFLDEARRLTAVRHPGIVEVLGMHDALGVTFIVLELIEGTSLDEALSNRSFGPPEAAGIVLQLSKALEALHAQGLLHLDLKPANIVLGAGQQARLIDLGIASGIGSIPELIRGTPRYVAPEVRAGEPLTAATDVYGLALVARDLLGERPAGPFIGRVLRRSLDPRPARRHQRPRSFAVAFATAVVIGQELGAVRGRWDRLAAVMRRVRPARRPPGIPVALRASLALGRARQAGPRAALAAVCAGIIVVALTVPRLAPAAAGVDRVELPAAAPLLRAAYALPPLGAYAAQFEAQAPYPETSAGGAVSWTVAIRNTGSAGWERGVAGAQASLALSNGTVVATQTTAYVAPGQTGWFVARFRAPVEPGAHLVPLRLVIDGAGPLPDLGIHAVVTVSR